MKTSIEKETETNKYYRKTLITTPELQLVVMNLKPKQEIGMEIHTDTSQFIRLESGTAKTIVNGKTTNLKAGDAIVIPKKSKHNIINTSKTEYLKIYTIYSPPVHSNNCKQMEKEDEEC